MKITIELPDELLMAAKATASRDGICLQQFLIEAIQHRLAPEKRKARRDPPVIGEAGAQRMAGLTREQIDEAMFC